MSELISVVVCYHNDGNIILDSVGRLLNVPGVEILIVEDGAEPVTPLVVVPDNVRVIRLSRNIGVGGAFDRGVAEAKGEIILLMGADVMQQGGWESHVRRLTNEHPKGIIAAACVGVTPDNGYEFVNTPRAGAELRLKQEAKSRDKWFAERNYNDILVGAWLNPPPTQITKCTCLMGASYAVRREWYQHIGGFRGFRFWGGLEPMISIKSYRAGGYIATDPSWVIGHVFGVNGGLRDPTKRRAGRINWYYYNKIIIAYTCLPELYNELNTFLGNAYAIGEARQLFKQNRKEIDAIRSYNEAVFTEKIDILGL